ICDRLLSPCSTTARIGSVERCYPGYIHKISFEDARHTVTDSDKELTRQAAERRESMKLLYSRVAATVSLLLLIAFSFPTPVSSQTPPTKAIVLAWDGAVPSFVHEMLRSGQLPNLEKLIAGGAFADDVIACFPSFTAPVFASLWTGAPPRITGISGNRVPRLP